MLKRDHPGAGASDIFVYSLPRESFFCHGCQLSRAFLQAISLALPDTTVFSEDGSSGEPHVRLGDEPQVNPRHTCNHRSCCRLAYALGVSSSFLFPLSFGFFFRLSSRVEPLVTWAPDIYLEERFRKKWFTIGRSLSVEGEEVSYHESNRGSCG